MRADPNDLCKSKEQNSASSRHDPLCALDHKILDRAEKWKNHMKKTDRGGMPLPPFRSISTADIHFSKTGYAYSFPVSFFGLTGHSYRP
jgi:hypothetical protein